MATKVLIPTALRQYAKNHDTVLLEGKTVGEVLRNLASEYSDLKRHLFSEDGRLRNFVNVYVNDDDIRYLQMDETPVTEADTVTIVPSVAGGRQQFRPEGRNGELTREEILRYSRHLLMPEVAMEGQKKLKAARVLLIGAGGLGSPAALYLAAAGVGTLGIVDFDVVDFTNLQRQILHATRDVGRPKLESAKERLEALNPGVKVETHEAKLTSENALEIVERYDVIVDGTDNFPTRYLVNDACVLLGKPNVYGSIFRFEGQASVFDAQHGPCYRCLYPEPPPPGLVPSCAEGGVLGVLPGIIGTIQALETIKLILGKGQPLVGRLLLFDALKMQFRELKLRKSPDCPVCGDHRTITGLLDYEEFCGLRGEEQLTEVGAEWEITPLELKRKLDADEPIFVLDVREPEEFEICRLPGSKLIPLRELPARVHELSTADEIVAHCRSGNRSARAVEFLKQVGFRKVKNLKGGILAWADQVDPTVPKY